MEPPQDDSTTPGEAELLDGVVAAIEAAIAEEPWRLENYHYLHDARLELAARQPLDKLDVEIEELDEAIAGNEMDADAYCKRGRAKYLRTVLSGEPADVEDPFADMENVTVYGDPFTAYHLSLHHAIADFDRAIELDPGCAEAYHMRGLAYHLQGLGYIGIALVESNPLDIEQAIRDYDRAIELDPGMTTAYHDRGSAYTEQGWNVAREATQIPEEVFQSFEQAIGDLTTALQQDPESESTYLNRAFANWLLSTYLEAAGEDAESNLRQWFEDSTRVIELNAENMWGYLFRALAYHSAQESAEDESTAAQLENQSNDDFEAFEELGAVLLQQYELSDLFSRVLTLSSGPPTDPRAALPPLLGTFEGDVYTGPDGSFHLQVPALMQPDAVIWDEMASSGDLLVWFEDSLSRWYAMQVHPGDLGEDSLADWVEANIAINMDVRDTLLIETELGLAVVLLHRMPDLEADCAMAVQHRDSHFYAGSYCLVDDPAGEEEGLGFRGFAELYGIQYEPVDALAEEFIRSLEIASDYE